MLYNANFCAECGEKVEDVSGFRLINRFLCESCAKDRGFSHLTAPSLLIVGLIFASYFVGGASQIPTKNPLAVVNQTPTAAVNQIASNAPENLKQPLAQTSPKSVSQVEKVPITRNVPINQANLSRPNQTSAKNPPPPFPQTVEINEAAYYCGAKTQKGTPCLRKVKGGGRCWQHSGKPAMYPPERLLIQPAN